MHNFGTVLRFELVRTLKKPTFWLSVLAFPALFGLLGGIIYYSNSTQDTREKELAKEPFSLVVKDDSKLVAPAAVASVRGEIVTDKTTGIERVRTGRSDAFFYYPADLTKEKIEVYNKNDGLMDNGKYTTVAKQLLQSSATSSLPSANVATAVNGSVQTTQTNYADGAPVNQIGRMIAPALFLVVFYAIIVLLGNQMLTSTTEEKENRVTEMLLTSISSRALIVGKIVSLIILGFLQIAVILLPITLVYLFARDALNIPDLSGFVSSIEVQLWPTLLGAALLTSGFLLFTGLLVGIGAATPTAKEANSFFGIVILIMIIPFYFFTLLMSSAPSPIVTGLSYFPLTAPFTLMIRNAFGTLAPHEAIIGLVIVAVAGIVAISAAVRIFRYGTLEYSNRVSLKNVFGKKKSATK